MLILLSLVYFVKQNSHEVTVTYSSALAFRFPVWGLILIPFFAGVVAGNLLDAIQRFRLKRELKTLRRELMVPQNDQNQ